jgi:Ca2+/H+ antiporter
MVIINNSMEIGSAYALQVCLLQIPAMVAFSAWYAPEKMGEIAYSFTYVGLFSIYLLVGLTRAPPIVLSSPAGTL